MIAITPDVAHAAQVLADWFARAAAASNDNRPAPSAWITQSDSPAGRRRHINECRRLVALGSDQARIVGRKYLLTSSAVDALLGRVTAKQAGPEARRPVQLVDELSALRSRLEKGRAA